MWGQGGGGWFVFLIHEGGIEDNVGSPLERPDFSHLKCYALSR